MYVCLCKALDENTLEEMKKKGCDTLKKVSKACGAGADCGSCAFKIHRLLQNEQEEELQPTPAKNPA